MLRSALLLVALLLAVVCGRLSVAPPPTRELLTGPLTIYVRSDGNDGSTCRADSAKDACRTWQSAVDRAALLDFGGQVVTIQAGDEGGPVVFRENLEIRTLTGGGQLHLKGSQTPGYTVLRGASTDGPPVVNMNMTLMSVHLWQMTLDQGQSLVAVGYATKFHLRDGVVFGNAQHYHVFVHDGQAVALLVTSQYTIDGSAEYHLMVNGGMAYQEYATVAIRGRQSFVGGFVAAINGGKIQAVGSTFTGEATGPRFSAHANGVIQVYGRGADYFPGSTPGTENDGGQYQ